MLNPEEADAVQDDTLQVILISSAQLAKAYKIKFEGLEFSIGSDNDDKIVYVGTYDTNFSTPEHISVNSSLSELLAVSNDSLINEPGWAWYSRLPSGWLACFGYLEKPAASDNVQFLCKRGYIR